MLEWDPRVSGTLRQLTLRQSLCGCAGQQRVGAIVPAVGREACNRSLLDFCRVRRKPLQVNFAKVAIFRDTEHWFQESQGRESEKNREGYQVLPEPSHS